MSDQKSYPNGVFCWADLRTPDLQAAKAFYGKMMGWSFELSGPQDRPYWMATMQGKPVAAIYQAASLEAFWSSYIAVDQMSTTLKKWESSGGRIIMPPTPADSAGTLAIVVDSVGATVALWQADSHPGAALMNLPGALCWNELNTRSLESAMNFYSDIFGWSYAAPERPTYQMIRQPGATGGLNGGMMDVTDMLSEDLPDFWSVYFATNDTDAFVKRSVALGAALHHGPADVKAGRFAILTDPTGGLFQVITLAESPS